MDSKELNELINEIFNRIKTDKYYDNYLEKKLYKEFNSRLKKYRNKKAILGFDIYKYSQFKNAKQDLIPFLFENLLKIASNLTATYNGFLFQKFKYEIYTKIIPTGDGGFLPFDNPMQAIVFLLNFNLLLKHFNSFRYLEKLRTFIGPITIRYALTYDYIFEYEKNIYGPPIIANARIMSKDSLDRFLIDQNTFEWFDKYIFGLENIMNITIDDLLEISEFKNYNKDLGVNWYIKAINDKKDPKISRCDVLKVDSIKAKEREIDIYNVVIAYTTKAFIEEFIFSENVERKIINLSLGNFNTVGLE